MSASGTLPFLHPLRVLVVDDDSPCLMIVQQMLRRCHYEGMDGFRLLELIGLELDLPVIMMSSNGETNTVLRGVMHGAVDFLIKPVRLEELRNLWQHVVRRRRDLVREDSEEHSMEDREDGGCETSKKRKEPLDLDDGLCDRGGEDDGGANKKARVVWSVEMHGQFVNAVNSLGVDKAVPKKILEIMNVDGLSRENVASHLQKYRLYLKRVANVSGTGVSIGMMPGLVSSSGPLTLAPGPGSNGRVGSGSKSSSANQQLYQQQASSASGGGGAPSGTPPVAADPPSSFFTSTSGTGVGKSGVSPAVGQSSMSNMFPLLHGNPMMPNLMPSQNAMPLPPLGVGMMGLQSPGLPLPMPNMPLTMQQFMQGVGGVPGLGMPPGMGPVGPSGGMGVPQAHMASTPPPAVGYQLPQPPTASSQQQQLMLGHQIMLQQQNLIRQQHQVLSSSNSQGASAALGGSGPPAGFPALNFQPVQLMDAPATGFMNGNFAPSVIKTEPLDHQTCSSSHPVSNGDTTYGSNLLPLASGPMQSITLQNGLYGSQRDGPSSAPNPVGPGMTVVDPNFEEGDHSALTAMFNEMYNRDELIGSAHDGMLMSGTAIGDVERDGGTGAGPKAPAREPQANSLLFSEYMDDLFPVENMDFFSG